MIVKVYCVYIMCDNNVIVDLVVEGVGNICFNYGVESVRKWFVFGEG